MRPSTLFLVLSIFTFSSWNGKGQMSVSGSKGRAFEVIARGKEPVGQFAERYYENWASCSRFCGECLAFGYNSETKLCRRYRAFCLGCAASTVSPAHLLYGGRYFITNDYPSKYITWTQGRSSCSRRGGDLAYFPDIGNYLNMYGQLGLIQGNKKHFVGIFKDGATQAWVKMYEDSSANIRWGGQQEPNATAVYGHYNGNGYIRGMADDAKIVAKSLCVKVPEQKYPYKPARTQTPGLTAAPGSTAAP